MQAVMQMKVWRSVETGTRAAETNKQKAANEAELMKDVANWEAGKSVYNTRWMLPMKVFGVND